MTPARRRPRHSAPGHTRCADTTRDSELRLRAGRGAVDATSEPDPGPAPEAVFDRVTGPYLRRSAWPLPGARACDEDA
jgi:hypothetical protein